LENIKILLKTSLDSYSDTTKEALEALEKSLVDIISTAEKYDDSELISQVKSIFSDIENL
jgi:hypothetical protein